MAIFKDGKLRSLDVHFKKVDFLQDGRDSNTGMKETLPNKKGNSNYN